MFELSYFCERSEWLLHSPHVPVTSLTVSHSYSSSSSHILTSHPHSLSPPTVPPVITEPLPPHLNIIGNPIKTFSVSFLSRFRENTTVVWYRDGEPISTGIETTFEPGDLDPRGTSRLELGRLSRSSRGEYRVEVTNSFPSIPPEQRVASTSVRLNVVGEP